MVSNVRRGDQVVTGGGMFGKVTKVIDETTVQVELAENVRVKVISSTLTDVLSKGAPVSGGGGGKGEGKSDDDGDGGKDAANDGEPAPKKSLFSFGSKK